jgi:hypothetical protein
MATSNYFQEPLSWRLGEGPWARNLSGATEDQGGASLGHSSPSYSSLPRATKPPLCTLCSPPPPSHLGLSLSSQPTLPEAKQRDWFLVFAFNQTIQQRRQGQRFIRTIHGLCGLRKCFPTLGNLLAFMEAGREVDEKGERWMRKVRGGWGRWEVDEEGERWMRKVREWGNRGRKSCVVLFISQRSSHRITAV